MLGRPRQDGAHRDIALAEPPYQVEALEGSYSAADNEENTLHAMTAGHAEIPPDPITNTAQGGRCAPRRAVSMSHLLLCQPACVARPPLAAIVTTRSGAETSVRIP